MSDPLTQPAPCPECWAPTRVVDRGPKDDYVPPDPGAAVLSRWEDYDEGGPFVALVCSCGWFSEGDGWPTIGEALPPTVSAELERLRADVATLTRERDEARAEVATLRDVLRWSPGPGGEE